MVRYGQRMATTPGTQIEQLCYHADYCSPTDSAPCELVIEQDGMPCTNPQHDHQNIDDESGEPIEGTMRCEHCGARTHYDLELEDYRHSDPATPTCFLVHRTDGSACTPAATA